jgi:hypothetical protein
MPFKSACFGAAIAAISLFSGPRSARADLLLFTITGHIDATFTLDSNATPNSVDIDGQPTFLNVTGTLSGGSFTFPDLTFHDGIHDFGGLTLYQLPDILYVGLTDGPQIYVSFPNVPPPWFTFPTLPQTYDYTNETLVISEFTAAVPGPTVGTGASSFALAALFLGWLVRRRAHQTA